MKNKKTDKLKLNLSIGGGRSRKELVY